MINYVSLARKNFNNFLQFTCKFFYQGEGRRAKGKLSCSKQSGPLALRLREGAHYFQEDLTHYGGVGRRYYTGNRSAGV